MKSNVAINKNAYASARLVRHYVEADDLFPAERAILEQVRSRLPDMAMLDVGVGGGRTVKYFGALARNCIGIDYAQPMIDACQRRFADQSERMTFELGDMREMAGFGIGTFDFVLASNNVLDCVDFAGRQRAIAEVRRVMKPEGLFSFSTHNFQRLPALLALSRRDMKHLPGRVREIALIRAANLHLGLAPLKRLSALDRAIVNDGTFGFKLRLAYIRPRVQLEDLAAAGFRDARVFSILSGEELPLDSRLESVTDPSLYFLCRA
ncbi:MAG TPA: class I SAM-dependent methyltransferase [Chloroflexota bacterium]|nr:class I SAM-dependent methyltransferase [Chloroflexota bacterium]